MALISKLFTRPGFQIIKKSSIIPISQAYDKQKINKFSSSPSAAKELFELRTYSVQPSKMQEFLTLTKEEFHLRTAHSKPFAYWTTELGGLNQVVHIWPYDSLSHRAEVRAKLSQSREWISKYISKVLPMLQSQDNIVLTLFTEHPLKISKECGFYELHFHRMKTSSSAWSTLLEGFLKSNVTFQADSPMKSSSLVGAFRTLVGPLNSIVLLWQHPTIDCCTKLQETLTKNAKYNELANHFADSTSKGLTPFNFSFWS